MYGCQWRVSVCGYVRYLASDVMCEKWRSVGAAGGGVGFGIFGCATE